ncbi:hypothetical protein SGLAM104S_10458 [Streptomyces glaucescens]
MTHTTDPAVRDHPEAEAATRPAPRREADTGRPAVRPGADADREPAPAGVDPLWARLRAVEERVRHAVAVRRAADPDPDDPYRGQYLSPEAAARILDEPGGLDVPAHEPWRPRPAPSSAGSPNGSGCRRWTWTCSWSRWRPTWTRGSSGSTATSTTT